MGAQYPAPQPRVMVRGGKGVSVLPPSTVPQGVTHRDENSPGGPGITLLSPRMWGWAAAVGAAHPGHRVTAAGVFTGQW